MGKPEKTKIILVCGGKFAGELYANFHGKYDLVGYIDDVYEHGYVEETYGLRKLGGSKDLESILPLCGNATISVTDASARKKYYEILSNAGFKFVSLIAPNVIIADNAMIEAGTIIRYNVIISPMVKIGKNSVIADKAYIGHDTVIGNNTFIASGVNINGSATIGDTTFIGSGAIILPKIKIGDNCIIGAGAVVNKDIESNSKAFGVPVRIIAKLGEEG